MSVHPHVFRSSLGQHRQIVEYQVRQTERGADIRLVADAPIDTALVGQRIGQALAAPGLDSARGERHTAAGAGGAPDLPDCGSL